MNDVQMFWSLCAERDVQIFWSLCAERVEFMSQMRSGAVLMESRHGDGQTDKQGLYQRKKE